MKLPLRALLIEDSADDAELVLMELQRGNFALTHEVIASAADLRAALARQPWDVILCDYRMPGFSGVEAMAMVQATGWDVPFIFVSGTMGEDVAVETMKQGAHDYVMKGNLKRLLPAIEREMREAGGRRERRQAEAALRASEEQLRFVTDHAPVCIAHRDSEFRYKFVNQPYAALFGLRPEELVGKHSREVLGEEGYLEARPHMEAVLAGKPVESDLMMPTGLGGRRTLHAAYTPERDSSGRVVGFVAAITDITERQQAETSLRASEERYRLLVEDSPDAIGIYQADGLVFVNAAGLKLLGAKTKAELLARKSEQIIHPEDYAVAMDRLRRRMAGETGMYPAEVRYLRLDGTVVNVEVSAALVTLDGQPAVQFIARDITERKRQEQLLREAKEFTERLIASMPDGFSVLDAHGVHRQVNAAFCQMTGFTEAELLGTGTPHPYWPPEEYDPIQRTFQEIIQGAVRESELTFMRKNGERFPVLVSPASLKNAAGNTISYFATVKDITNRKRLEERARQAQKMEAIGHLAGGMAHEFNNILAAVMMSLDLVKLHAQEPEARQLLNQIEILSQRAATLVSQLLAFSRQAMIHRQPLDLAALLAQQSGILNRSLGEGIHLKLSLAASQAWVHADRSSLEQVVLNLCLNARDAMPQGGMLHLDLDRLEVSAETAAAHPEVKPGKFICLSVTDTGCGMKPEVMRRLFEPFFTTKDVGQGTGLGLATVRGLVEQHHGWVEAETRVGEGSTFRVYLPAVAAAHAASTVTTGTAIVSGEGTILLVEDEPALLKVGQRLLSHLGYTVLAAADGAAALGLWEKHRGEIDLLYTDMVMPGELNGLQLAERLRAEAPGLRVIITSGYNTEVLNPDKDYAAAAIVYLPKPCPVGILTRVIKKCLQRKSAGAT